MFNKEFKGNFVANIMANEKKNNMKKDLKYLARFHILTAPTPLLSCHGVFLTRQERMGKADRETRFVFGEFA